MLSIKERQKRLSYLGYYTGKIDGIEGRQTRESYRKLQDDYFYREKDKDGIYGRNTEILLKNAYNVKFICKNFTLKEFHCHCNGKYCTGYPIELDTVLLANLQVFRTNLGVPINITSGLRCSNWNAKFTTSKNSRHTKGKAIDFYTKYSKDKSYRQRIINYWINEFVESRYGYCNGYGNLRGKISYPNTPKMGTSTHIDVI